MDLLALGGLRRKTNYAGRAAVEAKAWMMLDTTCAYGTCLWHFQRRLSSTLLRLVEMLVIF